MNALASLAGPVGLIAAGYLAAGMLPVAASRQSGVPSTPSRIAGALIALPIVALTVLILLAKLFDSAVLGWMFGLGLLACALLVPCAAFVALGWALGRRGVRRRASARGPAPVADEPPAPAAPASAALPPVTRTALAVRLERDGVHASDDDGLDTWLEVDAATSLSALLGHIAASRFLPSISGGRASWVVESPARGGGAIGVIAQQWRDPVLVVAEQSIGAHFADVAAGATPWLRLRYRGQREPADLVADLRGAAPPDATDPIRNR